MRVWPALGLLLAMAAPDLWPGRASAADLPDPWVELAADGRLDVRAVIAPGMACPKVVADDKELASEQRGQPDDAYPVQACVAHAPADTRSLSVAGLPAAVLAPSVQRIVVIGDTGCRLAGSFVQDCNDPAAWPFSTIARLAAARRPDLVIHVGDYHYRETACPAGRAGCAGSPYGDTWAVWQRDFFSPAAPLLAAAPWVMVRGNHEICSRGGQGWFRLLDPHESAECVATTAPYALRLPPLDLLMFDGADADDAKADAGKAAVYRAQLQSLLAIARPHAWLLTHRPVWALAEGAGIPPGATLNATEQVAIRGLVPPAVDLVLSGHVHDFTSYDFGPTHPAQLVVGESGGANDEIVQPLTAGVVVDDAKIRRVFGLSDYGYAVLHRVKDGWTATVYSVADAVLARCRLHGRDIACHAAKK